MRFWYGSPENEDDVDALFQIMFDEQCIDGLPSELQRPSSFVSIVDSWKCGGEHIWFISDDGMPQGFIRAEVYGENSFVIHAAALQSVRGKPMKLLGESAMEQTKRHANGKEIELLVCFTEENAPAASMARIMGLKLCVAQTDDEQTVYRRLI